MTAKQQTAGNQDIRLPEVSYLQKLQENLSINWKKMADNLQGFYCIYHSGKQYKMGKEILLDAQTGLIWRKSFNTSTQVLGSTGWRLADSKVFEAFARAEMNPWSAFVYNNNNNMTLFLSVNRIGKTVVLGREKFLVSYDGEIRSGSLGRLEFNFDYYRDSEALTLVCTDFYAGKLHHLLQFCYDNGYVFAKADEPEVDLLKEINWDYLKEELSQTDYARCRLPELEATWFTDVHKGLWEACGLPEQTLQTLGIRARDPKRDIQSGNVGIDFGTSSTVVSYSDENNRARLLRIGVDDFYKEPCSDDYENPTVLEFVDFNAFLNAWQSIAYQPLVRWDDVRCSHEARLNFRNNDGNPKVVGSILGKIKQWALRQDTDVRLRITDQINGKEHELQPLVLRNPVKGQMLNVGKNDTFDPIELYAWFLGLNINWRSRGIFLNYYMTFPVAYPKDVKEKILASFRRGLMRSLPQSLVQDSAVMELFKVEECATEPAAYVAAAMHAYGIEPTDEGVAYSVFDFGGGTTDFDFGYYRWANEEEEDLGLEEIFEHLEAAGDKFLGGENLLENLAYIVFRNNLQICRDEHLSFTRPLDAENFAGSEMLLEKTQAATTNTLILMSKLRAFWEKGEINRNGIERVKLINREGEECSVELRIPIDQLDEYLDKRIGSGIESFFVAMKKAFGDKLPREIHILLAGNSSRSRRVTDAFGLLPEDADDSANARCGVTKEVIDRIFGDRRPEIIAHKPLDAKEGDESTPTAKTGVALGILRICDGDKVKVINHAAQNDSDEAPFAHYVGKIRRRKFEAGISRNDAYGEWQQIGVVSEKGIFNLFHTQSNLAYGGNMEEGHRELKVERLSFPIEAAGWKVFVRAVSPHRIDVCVSEDAGNVTEDCLQELTLS